MKLTTEMLPYLYDINIRYAYMLDMVSQIGFTLVDKESMIIMQNPTEELLDLACRDIIDRAKFEYELTTRSALNYLNRNKKDL